MRTTCPSCDTAYTIPDDRIGPKGRKVRCTRCGEQWRIALAVPDPIPDPDPLDTFRAEAEDPIDTAVETHADEDASEAPAATAEAFEVEVDGPTAYADEPSPPTPLAAEGVAADDASDEAVAMERARRKPAVRKGTRHASRWKRPRVPVALTRLAHFSGLAVFLGACLVFAGLVMLRTSVVARVPALAGFYRLVGLEVNLRGLDFGPIETLREMADGQPVLVVEGSLANTSGTSREVPALRFALRDADAQELYAWSVDPRATVIAAGDRLRFRTRLVAPPERAADLQVRFAERRNRQAGLP